MKLKNKRADERYLFIWMVLNWVIIGIAIMVGVGIFYSSQADARLSEALILSDKVVNCLASDFKLSEISANLDVSSKCGLNKEAIEKSDLYYLEIRVNSGSKNEKLIQIGQGIYAAACGLDAIKAQKNLPKCVIKTREVEDSSSKIKYTLSVLAASNQI